MSRYAASGNPNVSYDMAHLGIDLLLITFFS